MGSSDDAFVDGLLERANAILELQALPRRTAEIAAPKIQAAILEEFDQSRGPRGEPWPALKDPKAGHRPLVKTGKMRASTKVIADGLKLRGRVGRAANLHQGGTSRGVPARPIVERGQLDGRWEKIVQESAEQALAESKAAELARK
jgi:hypothetical protein